MAYPPLHRKLYKNDGAGPELKEEIVPHTLTSGVTAPSFTLTANDKIWHNSVTDKDGKHWEEFYFSMGDDETKSPRIVFRGAGCDATEYGDNATTGSVSIRAIDGTNFNQITLYPNGNTYLSGVGALSLGGGMSLPGSITSTAADCSFKQVHPTSGKALSFGVGESGTNRGIYDENNKQWLFASFDNSTNVACDGWLTASGFTARSDRRLKENIEPVRYDLSSLGAYRYNFKRDPKTKKVGLIAQEVQQIIPDAVSSDKDGTLSLDYNAITAALVEEVKDLKRRCDALESEKVSLRAAVENLAEQKKSLKKISALLTEEQDILRNENDVAMNEIVELKKRIAAQEKANAMLASTVSALQNAIGALETK